jgi:Bacterial surface proteins containing Ig-like domains
MRYKKIVSGLLACAMVVTSAFAGNVATVRAEGEADLPVPVSTYDFNATEDAPTVGTMKEGVKAVLGQTNLPDYEGEFEYGAGRSGEERDFAVSTGKYGLRLPDNQLGENYSISFWVKPTAVDKWGWATSLLFVGTHEEPAKWISIATRNNQGAVVCWSFLGSHNQNGDIALKNNEWAMLTLVQKGDDVGIYLNGEKKVGSGTWARSMVDENQYITLAANNWDGQLQGLYDDVDIYNTALTDEQVKAIYAADTADVNWGAVLEKEGFTVDPASDEISMIKGKNREISVKPPASIPADLINITYASQNANVATVSEAGLITAVAAGNTTVSITVQVGEVSITKEIAVTVTETGNQEIAAEYDFSQVVDGNIVDISGQENHAKIYGTQGTDYEFLEGNVLNIKSNNSGIDLPKSIMDVLDDPEEFTIQTTFAKSSACGNNAWLFCFGSIPKSSGTNYLFLSPNFEGSTLRAGIKNSNVEKLFGTSIQPVIDKEYTVNMVFNHGKVRLYWNGIQIQGGNGNELDSGYSIMDDVVTPGTQNGVLGFIGKSCWTGDKNYQGKISAFKVYNRAMTNDEVQTAYQDTFQANFASEVTAESILGNNKSKDEVRYNLSLPSAYEEVPITWESLTPEVVSDAGVVTNGTAAQVARLKASVTSGLLHAETEITVTVQPADKTELNKILAEAEAATKNAYYSDASKAEVQAVIDRAKAAVTQTAVDNAARSLQNAMNKLDYSDLYKNPFTEIDESKLKDEISLAPNGTESIAVALPDSIKDIVTVTYASEDTGVASVDETGLVTGKSVGYTRVTATVKAVYDGFEMEYQTLAKVDFDINGVTAKAGTSKLEIGKTATTNITLGYSAAIQAMKLTPVVTYRATGSVAVDSKGKVTAKKAGTGKVFVKVSMAGKSITETITFSVAFDMSKVTAKANAASLAKGKTTTVKVTMPTAVKNQKPVVSYSASGAVTVDDKGKVKAQKAGTGKVTVTVAAAGKSVKKTVTIKVGELTGKSSVKVRKSITLKVEGISGKVKWSVNKSSLAKITQKGKLTAKKAGKVKVTAKVGKVTMTKTITIKK